MTELYIGVMSGTSLDGVDVTLCEIDDSTCKLMHSFEYPFTEGLKEEILNIISTSTTLESVGTLHVKLGHLFADCITDFIKKYSLAPTQIKAIGLHGQTLWHQPDGLFPFSMQLGCPNIVASKTGIQTVADFRAMDIANGGQGAPFAPAFHQFLFQDLQIKTAVLNIGGMANLSILEEPLHGWDTGVGNALLDYWVKECKGLAYDEDGKFARSGKTNETLLETLLADEYFKKLPPKSTGREYFNQNWLAQHLPLFKTHKDADIQRTLLELTALSISKDVQSNHVQTLIVCGGGAKNSFLMQRLKELNSCSIKISDELGISSDFMESMAFAWFAYKRIHRQTVNLKTVTGATKNSLLGGIYE